MGRFLQEDEYRGDGLNLYAYCDNNPVPYYDPSRYNGECNGDITEVPKTISRKTKRASKKSQSSIPDAVKGPDKGGIIYDDKPAGRPISKDYQEMGRNIEAYREKYGVDPNEIIISRYDPQTGKDAGTESYRPSDFDRHN